MNIYGRPLCMGLYCHPQSPRLGFIGDLGIVDMPDSRLGLQNI